MLLSLLYACGPVTAPEDFDELASFLYENFHNDSKYTEAGLHQLNDWLIDNSENLDEGYRIDHLSLPAIQTVEDIETELELIGISKSVNFAYPVEDIAYVNFGVHPRDVFTNPDAINEREYTGDPDCFLDQECEFLRHDSILQRSLPLNIEAVIYFATDVRWVETERGLAFIQRRWLTQQSEVNKDWLQINSGYALAITLPMEDGNAMQIETIWGDVILGSLPLPEDAAFILAVDVLDNILGQFEDYLDQHGTE
jgi:hypothetical protein